jgi:hypothetical protein
LPKFSNTLPNLLRAGQYGVGGEDRAREREPKILFCEIIVYLSPYHTPRKCAFDEDNKMGSNKMLF